MSVSWTKPNKASGEENCLMTLIVDKIGAEFTLHGYDNGPDYGKYQMVPLDGNRGGKTA
jgi:hypothetical protein